MWSKQTQKAVDLEEEARDLVYTLVRRWSEGKKLQRVYGKAALRLHRRTGVANQMRLRQVNSQYDFNPRRGNQ